MCDVHSPFTRESIQTARLVHLCDECFRPIMRGERYHATAGKWEGDFSVYRAHELCRILASQVSVEDNCTIYGVLREFVAEVPLNSTQARLAHALFGFSVEELRAGEDD